MESEDLGIVLCAVTIFFSESMPITDLLILLFFHHSLIVDSSQPSRRTTLINDKDRVPIRNGSWSSSSWTTQKPQEGADWLTCRNLRFSRKYSNEFLLKGLDRNSKFVSLSWTATSRSGVWSGLGVVEEIGWLAGDFEYPVFYKMYFCNASFHTQDGYFLKSNVEPLVFITWNFFSVVDIRHPRIL